MFHLVKRFLAVICFLFPFVSQAQDESSKTMNTNFTPDSNIQKIAEAYALDAVDFAKSQFNISLDWSDDSIKDVENILGKMHVSYIATNPHPTEEQVMSFAKAFGSYIGEVFRRHHGGEWGIVRLDKKEFPGFRTKKDINFWPWGKVFQRIIEGNANNITVYYNYLLTSEKDNKGQ